MLPMEMIIKIFSYIEKTKCYRCNAILLPNQKRTLSNNKIFCSINCMEYQHY